MFGRPASGLRHGHAAQAALDRLVCRTRRRRHPGGPAHRIPHLAARDGRGAPDEEVTRLDQTIDRAADKLQELADKAAGQNGLKGELELAKLELGRKVAALGLGIGFGLGAAVFALFGVAFLLAAAAAGLATATSTWLALLLVGLGLLLVTGLLGMLALRNIKKGTPP